MRVAKRSYVTYSAGSPLDPMERVRCMLRGMSLDLLALHLEQMKHSRRRSMTFGLNGMHVVIPRWLAIQMTEEVVTEVIAQDE